MFRENNLDKRRIYDALRTKAIVCGSVAYAAPDGRELKRQDGAQPLVSVITVTYNAVAKIESAIQSVAQQTYSGPIEYIIIDGGSSDSTGDIINRHLDIVDCYISEPDHGIYDAMNKGLLRARGRYIALLNSDDRLHPDFVVKSVEALEGSDANISYCDYDTETGPVTVGEYDDGLFVAQLGIKHNTFLFERECFEIVGCFDTKYKVVADAKWNRAAYAYGLKFVKIPGRHVFYSSSGLSSSATEKTKEKIISESSELLAECFPCLDRKQARDLYLANFDAKMSKYALEIAASQGGVFPCLKSAVDSALKWNFANRPEYQFDPESIDKATVILQVADSIGLPLDQVMVASEKEDTVGAWKALLTKLSEISNLCSASNRNVVLHFARVFSAPSETFIYDFLNDLADAESGNLHVVLCDVRKEEEGRPYLHVLTLPWDNTAEDVRTLVYDIIWQRLKPKKIIAHFALNGWWLHQRLRPEQYDLPWVNMCHGIDVFSACDDRDYFEYLTQYCADASNVVFSAVSEYLKKLLVEVGIPESKVFCVPNAVDPVFDDARKTDQFWRGGRPLRIVTVGRLIQWKGHDHLIHAISSLRNRPETPEIELEIVYGRWGERLDYLQKLSRNLGVSDCVRFVDFVDFKKSPEYLTKFDLFVLPSTLSDDPVPRTETFGVAMIEAIASGLPVIGTTAGGLPEVVGSNSPHARIVPNGDADALADAIADMIANAENTFSDNSDFAASRLALFSSEARLAAFGQVQEWLERPRPRIVHFCALGVGGAAGASINIHRGLLRRGFDSRFVTRQKELGRLRGYTPNVTYLSTDNSVDFDHNVVPARAGLTTFSLDDHAISNEVIREAVRGADLINITWPAKFLSVSNIAMLTHSGIPVTITVRDMNVITGGCHYFHGCDAWRSNCSRCPQLPQNDDDYTAIVLAAKKASWNLEAVTFIALSDHSLAILENSEIAKQGKRIKLSNYVDGSIFFPDAESSLPIESWTAQKKFKLGYLPSFSSRIKGHEKFLTSLNYLHQSDPNLDLAIVIAAAKDTAVEMFRECPFEVVHFEPLNTGDELRGFYNCLDAVAVPSLEETFSNTTVEALACGKPVVGFRTGVLGEILADERFGRVVEVGDAYALADAIRDLVANPRESKFIAAETARRFGETGCMDAYEVEFRGLIANGAEQVPLNDGAQDALEQLATAQVRRKAKRIKQRLYAPERRMANLELLVDWELLELATTPDLDLLDWKAELVRRPWDVKRWNALKRYRRRKNRLKY